MVNTLKDKDSRGSDSIQEPHLLHLWMKCENPDKQWTEFKNKLFKQVIKELGNEMSIHSPLYRPQSNGKIEGFHRFLKACIAKHINHGLEWDELAPMATACYKFFPNCSTRELTFFLMFGRDPVNKLNHMLHRAIRYFHDDSSLPDLEAQKNIYQVVAQQLLNNRERYMKKHQPKASGISSEVRGPHPDGEPHSPSLQTQIQERNIQGSESKWQPSGHQGLQRKHLHGTHHRCEEDDTDRQGC